MVKYGSNKTGQSTLETTIALVAAVILILGITQVFVWLNKIMVERHEAFESSSTSADPVVDFYQPEEFNIFGN